MPALIRVLILGASYGSLPGAKVQLAGHPVTLVCTASTALLINETGTEVRMPVDSSEVPVAILSRDCLTHLRASTPEAVNPAEHDLVLLAMQETHYGSTGMRELLDRIAHARLPTVAMMNMPPPAYLRRLGIEPAGLEQWFDCFKAWNAFDPQLMSLAGSDTQAFRPKPEENNVLHVDYAGDFHVTTFADAQHTALLNQLQQDVGAIRYRGPQAERIDLPVTLRPVDSLYAPLSKWSALLAGHYRCVGEELVQPINQAVSADLTACQTLFDWVNRLLQRLGARNDELMSFEWFVEAAAAWRFPSSVAQALANGATSVERVDGLVQSLAARYDMQLDLLDELVSRVDAWLTRNRQLAAPGATLPHPLAPQAL